MLKEFLKTVAYQSINQEVASMRKLYGVPGIIYPSEVEIEVVGGRSSKKPCQLRCEGCYVDEDARHDLAVALAKKTGIGLSEYGEPTLSVAQWGNVVENLHQVGVCLVNLFAAGEITLYKDPETSRGIEGLLRKINGIPTMDFMFSTHGIISKKMLKLLLEKGLRNVVVSVDEVGLDISQIKKMQKRGLRDRKLKAYYGRQLVRELARKRFFVSANCMVSRENCSKQKSLWDIYQELKADGIWTNFAPMQYILWGGTPSDSSIIPLEEDRQYLSRDFQRLAEEKQRPGNTLINSLTFLRNFPDLALHQERYRCRVPELLGVAKTGLLTYCVEHPGQVGESGSFNFLTISPKEYALFIELWPIDNAHCGGKHQVGGCTYSCFDRQGFLSHVNVPHVRKEDVSYPNWWALHKFYVSSGNKDWWKTKSFKKAVEEWLASRPEILEYLKEEGE